MKNTETILFFVQQELLREKTKLSNIIRSTEELVDWLANGHAIKYADVAEISSVIRWLEKQEAALKSQIERRPNERRL